MEVMKCNMEVAMETIGEVQNFKTKSKLGGSQFASYHEIVVDQLNLNAKNKSTSYLVTTCSYKTHTRHMPRLWIHKRHNPSF